MKQIRIGWLTGLAIAAVLAVNAAGIWGIAAARRGALEEASRAFADDVAAYARAIEGRLGSVRADLAFLAASSSVARLGDGAGGAVDEGREGAQSAVLLFLRGHPEVTRVVFLAPGGEPLLHAGRRGGVPLLWLAVRPTGDEGAALAPDAPRLITRVPLGEGDGPSRATAVEMEIAPSLLLESDGHRRCRLSDAGGRLLARDTRHAAAESGAPEALQAGARVDAEGWTAPAPWRLDCRLVGAAALAEPVAARYRTTLVLNLGVMALALFLGGFAVQQARRRARFEAEAREEARVRALERQLLHAERLTTVGRLAAGIAHEINNPLEGMANWLSLAGAAIRRGDVDEADAHLTRVQEGLDRAAATVRQVLAHADPARAPTQKLDLNQVLRDTGSFVQTRREFAGIDFRFELSERPLLVEGSSTMLGQVAVNLILNACEAQPEGGEVRVRSHREGDEVVAEFADRGPGVPEDDRQRILEPFYSTKDSTGLGLSICHTIVRQHGGELLVADREGRGAVIRVRLPAAAGEAP